MGTLSTSHLLPLKLNPSPLLRDHHSSSFVYRTRRKSKKSQSLSPVARLFGPAIFEASKLQVVFLGVDEEKHPGKLPRAYTLTHSDVTSKLTLAISQTINNSQLQGWYNRLQRDEVVAEWKKVQGKMSLHVHCHISGGHFLLNVCAKLRYFIFCKELPVVLKAFVYADGNLLNSYPELHEALVWVYFHSNIPEFNKVECWGPLRDASSPSTRVQKEHKNKHVFRNISWRKDKVLRRLKGLERIAYMGLSGSQLKLEEQLRREYEEILIQEEILWFQKSRINWLQLGDKNSKFFHMSTTIRRGKNKIVSLKDNNGCWVEEEDSLKRMALNFYKELYKQEQLGQGIIRTVSSFPEIGQENKDKLIRPVSFDEVTQVLKSMGSYKAPGPDGFQPVFYQSQWETVGPSAFNFIVEFFEKGGLSEGLNETFLILIPKVERPVHITQFRPISLCNTLYKLTTKIIANRLKPIMPEIISLYQSSFVQGRNITDNIIIVQEVIHSMKRKKGKMGWMAIKIDLEKAYDRLSWTFIKGSLELAGIPNVLVERIMDCVSSSSFNLLWNGETTEQFYPSRGIRQGDSLSPFLFVICMERLNHIIQDSIREKKWKGIKMGRVGHNISHLCFADDLFLFTEASIEQAKVVKECLNKFCVGSGQKVSQIKSSIFFSSNVTARVQEVVKDELGFNTTTNLGNYLGVPVLHGRRTRNTYNHLVEKVEAKLSGWKHKQLSFAGRITLASSVLQSVPIYTMQTAVLPLVTCDKIDKIIRKFIWGSQKDKKGMHLLNWSTVCKPKNKGGLGLRQTRLVNEAFLIKLAWNFMVNPRSLCNIVLRQKYHHVAVNHNGLKAGKGASPVWRAIVKVWDKMYKGCRWSVGNGATAKFWLDWWIPELGPLITYAVNVIPDEILHLSINQFVDESGCWIRELFQGSLPTMISQKIAELQTPQVEAEQDKVWWVHSNNGILSIKSVVEFLQQQEEEDQIDSNIWKLIWSWSGPQRLKTFLWLVVHRRLPTAVMCFSKKVIQSPSCQRCGELESVIHVLRDCDYAKIVWMQLVDQLHWTVFFSLDETDWIQQNLVQEFWAVAGVETPWRIIFVVSCWSIWLWRNKFVFDQDQTGLEQPVKAIMDRASEILVSNAVGSKIVGQNSKKASGWISWIPPDPGWIKINCDGSVDSQKGIASVGGVLRDYKGGWISGFSQRVNFGDVLSTELTSLSVGMLMAKRIGYDKVVLESDCAAAVDLLRNITDGKYTNMPIVKEVASVMESLSSFRVSHVFRECNTIADWMARKGSNGSQELQVWSSPPYQIISLLYKEALGLEYLRLG